MYLCTISGRVTELLIASSLCRTAILVLLQAAAFVMTHRLLDAPAITPSAERSAKRFNLRLPASSNSPHSFLPPLMSLVHPAALALALWYVFTMLSSTYAVVNTTLRLVREV